MPAIPVQLDSGNALEVTDASMPTCSAMDATIVATILTRILHTAAANPANLPVLTSGVFRSGRIDDDLI